MPDDQIAAAHTRGKHLPGDTAIRKRNSTKHRRLFRAGAFLVFLMVVVSACGDTLDQGLAPDTSVSNGPDISETALAEAQNATATSLRAARATDVAATSTSAAAAWATGTAEAAPVLAAAACTGQAVTRAAAYAEGDVPHLILIATYDGDVHGWSAYVPDEWRPDALGEVQLVACVAPETERAIEECQYIGPNITRYRYQQLVQIVVPSTGDIITESVIQGDPPRNCRQSEPYNLTELHGEHVEFANMLDWLAGIVEGNISVPSADSASPPSGESVQLLVSMLEGERVVSTNADVVLTLAWTATDEAYIEDFLDVASTSLEVDGVEMGDADIFWSLPMERDDDLDGDGANDYSCYWRYPLGSMEPGRHVITLTINLASPITDGYDFDGDGSEDYYSEPMVSELILTVQ